MPNGESSRRAHFTRRADLDLDLIEEYISSDNPAAARRLILRVREMCSTLADHPYIGVARPDFGTDLRIFAVPRTRYIIIYRPVDDGVEIIHILQGSQNIRNLFEA